MSCAVPPARARSFALAGVTLQMTPAQVVTTLKAAGYDKGPDDLNFDFQQKVAVARGGVPPVGRLGESWISEQHFKKQSQSIDVSYIAMPSGPVAQEIRYYVDVGLMSAPQVLAGFTKRYGARSYEFVDPNGSKRWIWCSVSSSNCLQSEVNLQVAFLGPFTSASLTDPIQRSRQADAIRSAPGAQKATF